MSGSTFGWRAGFTLMGVGPLLLPWLFFGPVPTSESMDRPPKEAKAVAFPDRFPLFPTMGNEGAAGMAYLRQPWSPFGVSVDAEGRVVYDLRIEVSGLPTVEGETYRVWLTTPAMDAVVDLGSIEPAGELTGVTDQDQLLVIVSRERADGTVTDGERWAGPVVLRGFSAGARVTPLAQHSLFRRTPM
ncbi:MAG: hypothetical protein Q8W45_02940 [Candidatus Palauibacterales bacterium]|nr:hypothetical protein [Candidatus Palauibacterales bacterium]